MEAKTYILKKTNWGLCVVLRKNIILNNSNIIKTIEQIIVNCKKNGTKRILIDATTTIRNASFFKLLEVAELIEKLGSIGLKIAIVAPLLADYESSRFMETAGYNRGVYIQYFHDKDKAEEWLLK